MRAKKLYSVLSTLYSQLCTLISHLSSLISHLSSLISHLSLIYLLTKDKLNIVCESLRRLRETITLRTVFRVFLFEIIARRLRRTLRNFVPLREKKISTFCFYVKKNITFFRKTFVSSEICATFALANGTEHNSLPICIRT